MYVCMYVCNFFSLALLPTTLALVLTYFNFAQLDKLFSFSESWYQFSVSIIFSFFLKRCMQVFR